MRKFFRKLYKLIDELIIVPISRLIYNIQKFFKKNSGFLDKLLNRPNFLIFLSLALAILLFLLVDSKAISFVEDETEVISNVPVNIKYNQEAYVIEGAPTNVNIMISGRKSDIYLAKQLGEYEVTLDLTEYKASDSAYKVYFTYAKSINNLKYNLDPSYVSIMIKNKVSSVSSVTYELINQDKLDSKLSVKSVGLSKSEVVVKGSETALKKIAWIKALVDLSNPDFTEAGSYDIDNILLVAYDNTGNILNDIEIVPSTLSATVVLDSYSQSIPIEVKTTGTLVSGKSIAKILINNSTDFSITVYGNEEEISKISSIPVTINVDGFGTDNAKNYNVTLTKPNGVRYMSTSTINVSLTFGTEEQKTVEITNISKKNLGSNLNANIISDSAISVTCKGVSSVLDKIEPENINAYVDLSGLGVGDHEVEVKIDNTNPLVTYAVSSTIKVRIS
ncbi:MAG: YbbR-like domain-containing protein [Bacilli bacterium]